MVPELRAGLRSENRAGDRDGEKKHRQERKQARERGDAHGGTSWKWGTRLRRRTGVGLQDGRRTYAEGENRGCGGGKDRLWRREIAQLQSNRRTGNDGRRRSGQMRDDAEGAVGFRRRVRRGWTCSRCAAPTSRIRKMQSAVNAARSGEAASQPWQGSGLCLREFMDARMTIAL